MKEFLFIFRIDHNEWAKKSKKEIEDMSGKRTQWFSDLAAQNKLTDKGKRLEPGGRIINSDGLITDGPYADIKESIGGYSIIKAGSLQEAAELAQECPILLVGGSVEVREISPA